MTEKKQRGRAAPDSKTPAVTEKIAETASADDAASNPALKALAERLPLWRRPGYLVRRLHQIHYAIFFEECDGFGITPVQYGLLTILSTNPDADQVTLANALGIDRTNVADVLVRLEQRGLIARMRSQNDRRMVLARLTSVGEDLVERMHPAMAKAQDRLLEALGSEERDQFLATLMRLLEANNKYGRATLGASKMDHT
ncbi:MarR family transcriptional regulator [Kaistia dalseonensis]|uniref:DNA-binding MarR family transcriptional regulator n=1 Tax=Kaistia dalseonensis TaxID=410840 RepID=A0ABU0HAA4_9HYPH|nr:MarR family transcriptional regulator [Kaistia dalseonensis]MCX5496627.1 MarR family transcriptional regulator [Kaistia dalseonensis]MDQ0439250.1 DNA-binding MarR family transcriptional regulator [Kaistia dalseonensis]